MALGDPVPSPLPSPAPGPIVQAGEVAVTLIVPKALYDEVIDAVSQVRGFNQKTSSLTAEQFAREDVLKYWLGIVERYRNSAKAAEVKKALPSLDTVVKTSVQKG